MTKQVSVDLSNWYVGEEWLETHECKVINSYGKFVIEIGDPREALLKKVLAEAMEAFLNTSDDTTVKLTKEGVVINGKELSQGVTVPWEKVIVKKEALAIIRAEYKKWGDDSP